MQTIALSVTQSQTCNVRSLLNAALTVVSDLCGALIRLTKETLDLSILFLFDCDSDVFVVDFH